MFLDLAEIRRYHMAVWFRLFSWHGVWLDNFIRHMKWHKILT